MRRIILILFVVILLPWGNMIQAQDPPYLTRLLCESLVSDGAMELCIAYEQCLTDYFYVEPNHGSAGMLVSFQSSVTPVQQDGLYSGPCGPQFITDILTLCDETPCEQARLLDYAAVEIAIENRFEGRDSDLFQTELATILDSYANAQYEAAANELFRLYEGYRHRLLPYAAGLAYEGAGDIDQAIISYEQAERTQFNTPVIYYSRGYLYAVLGMEERAKADFYTYAFLAEEQPDLDALEIPADVETYTLQDPETWTLFPLAGYGSSPGGEYTSNEFSVDSRDIAISRIDDGLIAVRGLYSSEEQTRFRLPDVLFFWCGDTMCVRYLTLQQTFQGLSSGGTQLTLIFDDEIATLETYNEGSESSSTSLSVLGRAPATDPRPTIPCENGVYPRLQVGDHVYPQPEWYPIDIYAAPNTDSEPVRRDVLDTGALTVSGPLVCGEAGDNWWTITLGDGTTGWVQEARGTSYILMTYDYDMLRRLTFDELLALPSLPRQDAP